MSLAAGSRLGPYEIVAPLGAGGMGEVYRAKDTRLGREVAVKVLPAEVASDPERLRRFEQEARAASALSHPNILTLFDVGRDGETSYLVTELLEGESLRERLAGGELPVRKAIELGVAVARGLAAAHAKGIVHRDLKPENLFLTHDGGVKILDFGLAKLTIPEGVTAIAEATTIAGGTETGVVMGTVGYMAPEQVRGERADARTDLFALGCVLYESVAGRRAFAGATPPDTLSAILRDEPPPLQAPGPTGTVLEGIVRRCLEKRPDDRFQSARDLGFALEALGAPSSGPISPTGAESQGQRRAFLLARGLGLAALALLAVVTYLAFVAGERAGREAAASPTTAFGSGSIQQLTTDPGYEGEPTFSPDGQTIAYVADRDGNFEIYLQQISGGPAINLTQNPAADVQPSFSPDGRTIAFVSSRSSSSDLIHAAPRLPRVGGDIWTMPALGGMPRRVVENGNYPSWSPDGSSLVFVHGTFRSTRLALVSANGGESHDLPIEEPDALRYFYPTFSDDGRWLLYQNSSRIEVVAISGGKPHLLAFGEEPTWGARSSTIVFTNDAPGKSRSLWQAPFDLERGVLSGPPQPLTFGPGAELGARVSRDGRTIAFASVRETLNLEEIPFDAETARPTGPPRELTRGNNHIGAFWPSPDGNAVVYVAETGSSSHLWRVDAPSAPVQLTLDSTSWDSSPSWSPDGSRIAFVRSATRAVDESSSLWVMSADGGIPRRVAGEIGDAVWLDDGQRLVVAPTRGANLEILDLRTSKRAPIEGAAARTLYAADAKGNWIVFQLSGKDNVDLAAVPLSGGAARVVVATSREDFHPFFSPSGLWLFFDPDHQNIMRVPGPAQGWRSATPEPVTDFAENDLYLDFPKLSGDGRKLFYTRGRDTGDIWILEADNPPAPKAP